MGLKIENFLNGRRKLKVFRFFKKGEWVHSQWDINRLSKIDYNIRISLLILLELQKVLGESSNNVMDEN